MISIRCISASKTPLRPFVASASAQPSRISRIIAKKSKSDLVPSHKSPADSQNSIKSFEYPQNPAYIPKHVLKNSNENVAVRYRKYLPAVVALAVGCWGLYTVYYFTASETPGTKESTSLLSPDKFKEFVISNKKQVDSDHMIIELAPKNKRGLISSLLSSGSYWNGSKLWSVEVKQPEIMIVRSYTPLPVIISETGDLRLVSQDTDVGKFTLYLKQYSDGEVAKWLCKQPIGATIELRGPFVDFEFQKSSLDRLKGFERPKMETVPSKVKPDPFVDQFLPQNVEKPSNLVFYTAGTGITPALQMLLSSNPFKGHTSLFWSGKDLKEISPFLRILYFLEKLDRVKFTPVIEPSRISLEDIVAPEVSNITVDGNIYRQLEQIKRKMGIVKYKQMTDNSVSLEKELADLREQYKEVNKKIKSFESFSTVASSSASSSDPVRYANALHQASVTKNFPKPAPSLAIVCGPPGYIASVAGAKPTEIKQGVVGGMLKEKGWDEGNVYKL